MPSLIWFVVGVILGQFAESVLIPLWMKLGLLLPVGHWLDSFGIKSLDWCWLVVDIWLVSWLIAALVSIIGGLYIRHQFLRSIVLFGVGFAFVPLAVHSYLYSHVPTFADYWQHAIIFAIILVSGFVSHRWNRTMPPIQRWSQRRLRLEFMNGLNYTTVIEIAEPLAGRRGSALER